MTVERIHRFLMAVLVGLGTYMAQTGNDNGFYILYFVAVMLVFLGLTGFCPSIWVLKLMGVKSECEKD